MSVRPFAIVLALALGACAAPAARIESPPPAASAPAPAPAPSASASESPRQADQLLRIASELVELQNAMAKLMISSRQQEDQLVYLQRRLTELETQARARGAGAQAFAPSAPLPPPLPPPPATAVPPSAPMPLPPPAMPPRAAAVAPPARPAPPARVPGAPPAVPMSPAETLYQSGRTKYEAGDLDGAVVTLYEVVANHPGDPVRERAQLLVGEIFLAQKDYRGAIAELEGLVAAVPRGSRVPEALVKIGLAQRALGDETRARRAWERVVKDYPQSPAAKQARSLLSQRGAG